MFNIWLNLHPRRGQSQGWGIYFRLSVCLSVFRTISQKPMRLESSNLTQKCSSMSPKNASRSGVTKALPVWVLHSCIMILPRYAMLARYCYCPESVRLFFCLFIPHKSEFCQNRLNIRSWKYTTVFYHTVDRESSLLMPKIMIKIEWEHTPRGRQV